MDDKVISREGEDLGKFEDLMIDLAEGRIAYSALSFGGFLGVGDKLFSIPWKALTLRVHEHAFVLDIPKEVLENAEGFDKDNWPATSRESLSTIYSYYGYQPYWQTGVSGQTGISTGMPGGRESERMARMETERRTGMPGETESERMSYMGSTADIDIPDERMARMETERRTGMPGETESERMAQTTRTTDVDNIGFLRASKIQGEKVVNGDNDTLGKIEDIMIDLQDGRIAYAVISHGGIIGIGSKHIPIPWQAFNLRSHDNAFVVNIPKDVLDRAEGLDKDKWPVTREELSSTYSYYGYQPYWQMGAAAGLAGVSAAAAMPEREVMREAREPETTTMMESERVVRTETGMEEPLRTEEGIKVGSERERLEILKAEEGKRLSQLERDLEEARRQEETERVTQLEEEFKRVSSQEEAQRERLAQLERERIELERQTETEKERLERLEKEKRMEA